MRRYVVVGLGSFGSTAAEALFAQGHEVVVIDRDQAAVDRAAARVSRAAVGDGRDARTVERVGARDADVGIVSTGDDIAASILTTLVLKDLGVRDVYVKVISIDHARVMERIGVTDTIFPEHESASALASRLSGEALLNFVRLAPGFSLQEMAVPASWQGQTLRMLGLPQKHHVAIVAVRDVLTEGVRTVPDPDAPLADSDTLLVAGRDEDLARVARLR